MVCIRDIQVKEIVGWLKKHFGCNEHESMVYIRRYRQDLLTCEAFGCEHLQETKAPVEEPKQPEVEPDDEEEEEPEA